MRKAASCFQGCICWMTKQTLKQKEANIKRTNVLCGNCVEFTVEKKSKRSGVKQQQLGALRTLKRKRNIFVNTPLKMSVDGIPFSEVAIASGLPNLHFELLMMLIQSKSILSSVYRPSFSYYGHQIFCDGRSTSWTNAIVLRCQLSGSLVSYIYIYI